MAANMGLIAKKCFPNATRVRDRFHVQKLALEALQEIRIKYRWQAIDQENEAMEKAKLSKKRFKPILLANHDTIKQLLARSRYFLYKNKSKWSKNQTERAEILFELYPDIKRAYDLPQDLRNIFEKTTDQIIALSRLARWHEKVNQSGLKSFNTISRSIMTHYQTILTILTIQVQMLLQYLLMQKLKGSEVSLEKFGKSTFSCSDYLTFLDNPQLLRLIQTIDYCDPQSWGR